MLHSIENWFLLTRHFCSPDSGSHRSRFRFSLELMRGSHRPGRFNLLLFGFQRFCFLVHFSLAIVDEHDIVDLSLTSAGTLFFNWRLLILFGWQLRFFFFYLLCAGFVSVSAFDVLLHLGLAIESTATLGKGANQFWFTLGCVKRGHICFLVKLGFFNLNSGGTFYRSWVRILGGIDNLLFHI